MAIQLKTAWMVTIVTTLLILPTILNAQLGFEQDGSDKTSDKPKYGPSHDQLLNNDLKLANPDNSEDGKIARLLEVAAAEIQAGARLDDPNLFEGDQNIPDKPIKEANGLMGKKNDIETQAAASHLDNPHLFEGDLAIPRSQIEAAYGRGRASRAYSQGAISNPNRRWPNGRVHYEFDRSVGQNLQQLIRNAIAEYERTTCLRFFLAANPAIVDRIRFLGVGNTCSSSSIGKQGGVQTITLPVGCQSHRTILHEIGHAIGFWHEQSRPDRDRYLNFVRDNVIPMRINQFKERSNVDYQGEGYDYGSVMHYFLDAFTRNGRNTLQINNQQEYRRQGQPNIGYENHLSASDIRQVQKMYKCFNRAGIRGFLHIRLRHAIGLPVSGYYTACVTSFDSVGGTASDCTRINANPSNNPAWNQVISSRRRSNWRYFTIEIWQNNRLGLRIRRVINPQTIWIESPEETRQAFCVGPNECVNFTYVCTG